MIVALFFLELFPGALMCALLLFCSRFLEQQFEAAGNAFGEDGTLDRNLPVEADRDTC